MRELENRVQRAVILASEAAVRPEDLELAEREPERQRTLQEARDEAEHAMLEEALRRNAGNVTRAARELGVSRPSLHDLLRKHGIEAAHFRQSGVSDDEEGEDD